MKNVTLVAAGVVFMLAAGCAGDRSDDRGKVDEGQLRTERQDHTDNGPVLGQTWKDPAEMTMNIDGQDVLLKHVGMGIRWGKKSSWNGYFDSRDTLSDTKEFPESPNEPLLPGYTFSAYVTDPTTLVREVNNTFDNPWAKSLAKQKAVVFHLTFARKFDIDLFVTGVRIKWKGNSFPETGFGDLATDLFPADRPARDAFNHAYNKVGWYEKGDVVDFVVRPTPEGKARAGIVLHTLRADGPNDRLLYVTEGPGRLPYAEGSAEFAAQIIAIWFGWTDDAADPGFALLRKSILSGAKSVTF